MQLRRAILLNREAAMDGRKLSKTISELGITIMQATPATWRLMLEAGWKGHQKLKILSGGEAISKELATKLIEKGAELWNLYGPTETTIWSTIYQVRANERRISIGKPIANTEIYILDSFLQPVPIRVAGELHIGGAGLAKGYLKRPDLTAERFIPNPFSEIEGSRIYKTGDLARYLPDGNIECLGRLDFQVKIRGFRIELGEIEALLAKHPDIREMAVIVREDVPGDKRLVAYIVPTQERTPTVNNLRDFLSKHLPNYMVPTAFVILEALPLTPNGKIDRCALPTPDYSRRESENTFIAPRNQLEIQLTKIWEQVLGVQPISITDNFFELGGNSLLALRLVIEIQKILGSQLPLVTLIQAQTVKELATIIQIEEPSQDWEYLLIIQPGMPSKLPIFCIHALFGTAFFYQNLARYLDPEQPFYALQAQGLDGRKAPLTSINEIVTRYIKEIQKIQPEGPYFLGGFSLGGIIALEIAQQLRSKGQEIALLAVFDEPITNYVTKPQTLLGRNLSHINNLLSLRLQEQVKYLWVMVYWHLTVGKVSIFYKLYLRYIKRALAELRIIEVARANALALNNYVAQAYPGKVSLFRASDEITGREDPLLDWDKVAAGGVEIYKIPGATHNTLMEEPYVRLLAEKLMVCLRDAQK